MLSLRSKSGFIGCLIIKSDDEESESWGHGVSTICVSRWDNGYLSRHCVPSAYADGTDPLSKQIRFLARLNNADSIHSVLEHGWFDMAQRRDLSGGFVGSFLNHMAYVPL